MEEGLIGSSYVCPKCGTSMGKKERDSNVSESTLDKTNHNVKKKKQNKKRKNRTKESSEEFIFPKKTARPVSPISTQDPIETKNNFSDLEQDVEHPLPTNENVISETITPPTKPPYPVMLKIKDNFRDQMKLIINKFPNLRNRIVGDVVKMFSNDQEERRSLIQFLKTDIDFEFYVIDVKKDKPIKAVIKGLPNSSKTDDITSDLADAGRRAVLLARGIVRSVPLEIVGSSGHEKVPTCRKPGLERPGRPRGERIVRQALVGPTVTHSTIRPDVGVAIVPQTISRHLAEANLKSKCPFRALPLTPEHRQLHLQWCQARSMWNVTGCENVVFSDESGLFWGQTITVCGCGGTLVSGTIPPTLFYVTLPAQLV
ncbi:HTH_Tnp_Tc3_2 domain-containing protein [Trichonephila clavipes]|nr:HTH_Tnp_Tc3_2 domain-containing protein [Trichonephila clavipes]